MTRLQGRKIKEMQYFRYTAKREVEETLEKVTEKVK